MLPLSRSPSLARVSLLLVFGAVFSLPEGVTLRIPNAGNGWTCTPGGAVTCMRPTLNPGWTTRAHIHLTVAADASDGVPSVVLSGPSIEPVVAVASRGVGSFPVSAAMEATAQAPWWSLSVGRGPLPL